MVDPRLALSVFALLVGAMLVVFWPRRGLWARVARVLRLTERVRLEDALKHVYTWEQEGRTSTLESLAGRVEVSTSHAARLLVRLAELGLVQTGEDGTRLTSEGRDSALRLVRTHRLWERYLADRTGVPAGEWHDEAERMEHSLSAQQVEALSSRLGHPQWDPHGDPIPTPGGQLPDLHALSLAGVEEGAVVEVVHLEDEPREIFDALLSRGFALGASFRVLGREGHRVRVALADREVALDNVEARNVTVRVLPEDHKAEGPFETLDALNPGDLCTVIGVSPASQGQERRRLLDLGVVPGTEIEAAFRSAGGDPMAYSIRGALIALRRSQARSIRVTDIVPANSRSRSATGS